MNVLNSANCKPSKTPYFESTEVCKRQSVYIMLNCTSEKNPLHRLDVISADGAARVAHLAKSLAAINAEADMVAWTAHDCFLLVQTRKALCRPVARFNSRASCNIPVNFNVRSVQRIA